MATGVGGGVISSSAKESFDGLSLVTLDCVCVSKSRGYGLRRTESVALCSRKK